jgi:hypothetical protein
MHAQLEPQLQASIYSRHDVITTPLIIGLLRPHPLLSFQLFTYLVVLSYLYIIPSNMPWTEFKLNDGHKIPGVGFGSSGHPLERTADDINLAIECGFDHIDTAQSRSPSLSHDISRYCVPGNLG